MPITIKRIYDDPAPSDGFRVLVDRLWPRGVAKDSAQIDEWAKDAAPSNELRKAYHADEISFAEFAKRYRKELAAGGAQPLIDRVSAGETVTLLYAVRNTEQNHAMVLCDFLSARATP
ncbi:MAG: DUF488 domain-containing protein [Phycisphaerales bacterium]